MAIDAIFDYDDKGPYGIKFWITKPRRMRP